MVGENYRSEFYVDNRLFTLGLSILFTLGLRLNGDKVDTCEDVVEAASLVLHGGDLERRQG